jgi:hypothetical protein
MNPMNEDNDLASEMNITGTVTAPPSQILKMLILQKRYDVQAIISDLVYKKNKNGHYPDNRISQLKTKMNDLYLEIYHSLARSKKPEEMTQIELDLESDDFNVHMRLFKMFMIYLDEKQVLKIDWYEKYDRTSIEGSNKARGLG